MTWAALSKIKMTVTKMIVTKMIVTKMIVTEMNFRHHQSARYFPNSEQPYQSDRKSRKFLTKMTVIFLVREITTILDEFSNNGHFDNHSR